ncbi:MAG: peptidylprolyl isomerase [Hyphomicrobiaceae bacterium]|nr:peptidylprolyl isomerase [Hyphomicrobiaceae bacterium]
MDIGDKCVVSFHYTLTNADGEKLDSSDGRDPLKYLHGASNIVPGLEKALEGKSAGDNLKVTVEPGDAYGDVNPELVHKVPRTAFESTQEIKPGMQFQAQGPDGEAHLITVKDVDGEEVTVDANHPLAGQTLHFDVEVKDVREATKEELENGHAH